MIKVSVFYPNKPGARFDMAYYCAKHIPLVLQKLGTACKGITVDQGVAGGGPGTAPAFIAMSHLLFDSVAAFQAAFAPHAQVITGNMPNYTDLQPAIQISEVKL